MKKLVIAAIAAALIATAAAPTRSFAGPVYYAPVGSGSSVGAGIWFSGGLVALAVLAMLYDLNRRTTCAGDILTLGGPGFSSKIKPTDNVLPPQCRR